MILDVLAELAKSAVLGTVLYAILQFRFSKILEKYRIDQKADADSKLEAQKAELRIWADKELEAFKSRNIYAIAAEQKRLDSYDKLSECVGRCTENVNIITHGLGVNWITINEDTKRFVNNNFSELAGWLYSYKLYVSEDLYTCASDYASTILAYCFMLVGIEQVMTQMAITNPTQVQQYWSSSLNLLQGLTKDINTKRVAVDALLRQLFQDTTS